MKRYYKIYMQFLKQYLKTLIEYKEDFFFGIFGFFLVQATSIIFISLIFTNIPSLHGWSFYEIIFIYGFSQIPRGLDHLFTDYLWLFCWKSMVYGEFDRFLLRPLNPLFQVIAQRFQPDGFGELVIGLILVIYSGTKIGVTITPIWILGFIIAVIGGSFIYTAVKLATTSVAFWTKDSFRLVQIAYGLSDFSKYPISIYPGGVRGLLTFIIPFAFTGYYPATYLLGKGSFLFGVILTLVVGIISLLVAYMIWLKGISSYESAGN